MKSIVKTITTIGIVFAVLAALVGVSLIAHPVASILVYGIIFGIYLLAEGIMLVVLSIKTRKSEAPVNGLLKGILSIILGIMLLQNADAEWMALYFGTIFGIDIIITGIIGITTSVSLRKTDTPWVLPLVLSIISIIFGSMVLYSPIFSALTITVFSGIVLIVEAVLGILLMILLRKNEEEVEKIIIQTASQIEEQEAKALEAKEAGAIEAEEVKEVETEEVEEVSETDAQ